MELFHIHNLGNYDNLYVPDNEINVDETFNNSLYHSIFNLNANVTSRNLPGIFEKINKDIREMDISKTIDSNRLDYIFYYIQNFGYRNEEEFLKLCSLAATILKRYYAAMNEVAYEQSRQIYCPNAPSRLHSMFGCTEQGVSYWASKMDCKRADVYKIEVFDEPLLTNPSLLPTNDKELYNKVTEARKYFGPLTVNEDKSNEYLINGRVLLKEKVQEIRRR